VIAKERNVTKRIESNRK